MSKDREIAKPAPPIELPSPYALSTAERRRVLALVGRIRAAQTELNEFVQFIIEDAGLPDWEPKYELSDDAKKLVPNPPAQELRAGPPPPQAGPAPE